MKSFPRLADCDANDTAMDYDARNRIEVFTEANIKADRDRTTKRSSEIAAIADFERVFLGSVSVTAFVSL